MVVLLAFASRLVLGSVQWVPGALFLGVERLGPQCRDQEAVPPVLIRLNGVELNKCQEQH
jgi:hypothetical protein